MSMVKGWAQRSVGRGERPETRRKVMKTVNRIALLGALSLAGCTAGYVKDGNAPVQLIIANLTPNPMSSEVLLAGSICADFAKVAVANRAKNPTVTVPQVTMAIIVNRYEVSYYRSDGRGVQGVDVPYSISGALNASVDAATNGTTDISIEVVRRQAKLEPPLIQLEQPDNQAGGQALILTMFAKITLYGQTIAGQSVSASGSMQIDFADYVDTGTAQPCPTS
jgi:hypothetical protein